MARSAERFCESSCGKRAAWYRGPQSFPCLLAAHRASATIRPNGAKCAVDCDVKHLDNGKIGELKKLQDVSYGAGTAAANQVPGEKHSPLARGDVQRKQTILTTFVPSFRRKYRVSCGRLSAFRLALEEKLRVCAQSGCGREKPKGPTSGWHQASACSINTASAANISQAPTCRPW